jgi:hypothetical protein
LTKPSAGIKFSQMATTSQVQKNLRNAMKEALRIQDRFVAEPHFAKTGRGYLKSEGGCDTSKDRSQSAAGINFLLSIPAFLAPSFSTL